MNEVLKLKCMRQKSLNTKIFYQKNTCKAINLKNITLL